MLYEDEYPSECTEKSLILISIRFISHKTRLSHTSFFYDSFYAEFNKLLKRCLLIPKLSYHFLLHSTVQRILIYNTLAYLSLHLFKLLSFI